MLDRASTFANPQVVKLLKTRFIPVAIDQAYQRRQKDAEGEFYRKIASQGPRKPGQGTTQGLYAASAAGDLLGFTNNRAPERVSGMLNKSLTQFKPAAAKAIQAGKLDARYNPQPPAGGMVVRVHTKILSGYEDPENEYRRIFQESIGRDNLWVRKDEHQSLVKGEMPKSLLIRLARYHLVDNTRGEPPMWQKGDVKRLEFTFEKGVLEADMELSNSSGDRAYRVKLLGKLDVEGEKVTRFDVVAKGQFRGEGRYTRGAPKGWFPLAVVFNLADGSDMADRVPPQGSRGWVDGYIHLR